MSVDVKNGISVLRSWNGNAIKFRGSEAAPVLYGTELSECAFVGEGDRSASKGRWIPRIHTELLDAEALDTTVHEFVVGDVDTSMVLRAVNFLTLRPFRYSSQGETPTLRVWDDGFYELYLTASVEPGIQRNQNEQNAMDPVPRRGAVTMKARFEAADPEGYDVSSVGASRTPTNNPDQISIEIVDTTPSISAGNVLIVGVNEIGEIISEVVPVTAAGTFLTENLFSEVTTVLTYGFVGLGGGGDETISVKWSTPDTEILEGAPADLVEQAAPAQYVPFAGKGLITVYYEEFVNPSVGERPDVSTYEWFGVVMNDLEEPVAVEGVEISLLRAGAIESEVLGTSDVDGLVSIPDLYSDKTYEILADGDPTGVVVSSATAGTEASPIVVTVPAA